jgi:hypothetical protein
MRLAATFGLAVFSNESRSNRAVPRTYPFSQMTQDNGDGQVEDFFRGALAARILHPVQVEIIEAARGPMGQRAFRLVRRPRS